MSKTDRLSELPDFILHDILSILDTKEVCRASVLSKKWFGVCSSIPVLDFQARYLNDKIYDDMCDDLPSVQPFYEFIEETMQRYSLHKYKIRKLNLDVRMASRRVVQPLVDKWIGIAVQNQIEELDIHTSKCVLPDVLFNARSLKVLKCEGVVVPYYETMNLISLEHMTLAACSGAYDMLQRIISLCPLDELLIYQDIHLIYQDDLKEISLPWPRKVNKGDQCFDSRTIQSDLISPLRNFVYSGLHGVWWAWWPWNINVVALKNLKRLEIHAVAITDDIVSEVASGLVALESLLLSECSKLKCIKISSVSLKEFRFEVSLESVNFMTKAKIDTPNLLEFWYNCGVEASLSLRRVQDHCNAHFFPLVKYITTDWFVKLKRFLKETGCFKSLVMDLESIEIDEYEDEDEDEDELRDAIVGSPYKLKELKFRKTSTRVFCKSSYLTFLDRLFLCCRPDVLSMTASFQAEASEMILSILKSKVKCWKHPLKSIEVEGADCSSLLSESSEIEIRLRLTWSSVEP